MIDNINEIVIAIIGIVTTGIITLIANTFNNFIKNKNLDTQISSKLNIFTNLVVDSVRATQQKHVNSLKERSIFDAEQQKIALDNTKNIILRNLSEEMISFLKTLTPNLNDFIDMKIESIINKLKNCSDL